MHMYAPSCHCTTSQHTHQALYTPARLHLSVVMESPACAGSSDQGSDWDELDAELDEALDQALGLSSSPLSEHTTLIEPQHESAHSSPPQPYSPTRRSRSPAAGMPSTSAQHAQEPQQPLELRRGLEGLPVETLMRVCSFLSAEDLMNAARCSKLLGRLCAEPVLWRRLFRARWGSGRQAGSAASWKGMYFERDLSELKEALDRAPEPMKDVFVEMQLAKRQRTVGRTPADDSELHMADDTMAARVNMWRRTHGFGPAQPRRPKDVGSRSYHVIGDYFCDTATGWAHLCDETCVEQIVDRASGLMVCVVSGRMSQRMVEADADDEDDGEAAAGQLEEGGGRLAQAYYEGWDCADEQELERRCGVRLSP